MGILTELPFWVLAIATSVTLFAGFVKGAVGFGMPLIMISGLAAVLPAETALAALILPTLMTNGQQALRHGMQAAREAVLKFRVYLMALALWLVVSAQLVTRVPQGVLFILIGVPVFAFSLMQLRGWTPRLQPKNRVRDEGLVGSIAGFVGGLSGVWGPPTIVYLTALETPKEEQMRVQGVIYGIGALVLVGAHMKSGVFNVQTAPLSVAMMVPAFAGMWIGGRFNDQMPQKTFKRATLIVLTVAGLNLIRKGLMG